MPFAFTSKRSSSSSDPKNASSTQTPATVAADVDAKDTPSRPLSPVTNQPHTTKDMRAFEHDRQRSKQTQELAKLRAKKAEKAERREERAKSGSKVAGAPSVKKQGSSHGGTKSSVSSRLLQVDMDEDEIFMAPIERGVKMDTKLAQSASVSPRPQLGQLGRQDSAVRPNVSLADLVVSSTRKPKKAGVAKVGDDDFEVIPHVKAVIALDDVDDMELDEPWEHVQADEAKGRRRFAADPEPSYANIVAGSGYSTPAGLD